MMSGVKTPIRRIGNSRGILLPKPLISQLALESEVEVSVEGDAIVLRKPRKRVREGWAAAAKGIALRGQTGIEWPPFSNAGDQDLQW